MAAHAIPGSRQYGVHDAVHLVGAVLILLGTVALATTAAAVFLLHLSVRPVLSPSMEPTYGPGWAIVTRPEPAAAVRPGDIIVFTPPGSSTPYAHRVISVAHQDGTVIRTKGDANPAADPWRARITGTTVPRVVLAVPSIGRLLVALRQPYLRAAGVLLVGLIVCLFGSRAILRGPNVLPSHPRPSG